MKVLMTDYKRRNYIEIILVDYVGVVALFALVYVLTADVISLFNRLRARIS